MIVKIIPTTDTNIVLSYSGRVYVCFAPANVVGAVFQIGSSVIAPTVETGTSFANEIDLIMNESNPYIIDDNGNVYLEVNAFKENLAIVIPTRL